MSDDEEGTALAILLVILIIWLISNIMEDLT